MACINSALVGSTWVFFSYIQINLFLSWTSSSVETQTICFPIFGKISDHVVRQSNISTPIPFQQAWPSSVRPPMYQVQGQDLNYCPVKLESRFPCSLVWRLQRFHFIYLEILRISAEQIQNGLLFPIKKETLKQNQLTKIPIRFKDLMCPEGKFWKSF